jgi:hypothetical protein
MYALVFFALFFAVVAAADLSNWAADGQVITDHTAGQALPALATTDLQALSVGRSAH